MRSTALFILVLAAGCDSAPPAVDTYSIDLSYFPTGGEDSQGGPPWFANESLAFRPEVSIKAKVITSEGDDFRKIYNRLPCQRADASTNDALASQGFAQTETEHLAAAQPVQLVSVSVEKPDGHYPPYAFTQICFAYHTADGTWHGSFAPVEMMHDDGAKLSRVTLPVAADHVDIVGLVIYDGLVSSISFVARPD